MTGNDAAQASPDWQAKRDQTIQRWLSAKEQLALIKEQEMELRKQVSAMLFPTPTKGTQRFPLGNGYAVKLVHKINYKLGDPDLTDKDGAKIKVQEQIENVMNAVEKCGNEGAFLVDRLFKTSYSLYEGEYNKLDPTSPIKQLIDKILTTEDASPSLELESPKEVK